MGQKRLSRLQSMMNLIRKRLFRLLLLCINKQMQGMFCGISLREKSAPPPKQFEDVLNFFMDYFSKGHVLSTIAQDSTLKKVF